MLGACGADSGCWRGSAGCVRIRAPPSRSPHSGRGRGGSLPPPCAAAPLTPAAARTASGARCSLLFPRPPRVARGRGCPRVSLAVAACMLAWLCGRAGSRGEARGNGAARQRVGLKCTRAAPSAFFPSSARPKPKPCFLSSLAWFPIARPRLPVCPQRASTSSTMRHRAALLLLCLLAGGALAAQKVRGGSAPQRYHTSACMPAPPLKPADSPCFPDAGFPRACRPTRRRRKVWLAGPRTRPRMWWKPSRTRSARVRQSEPAAFRSAGAAPSHTRQRHQPRCSHAA